MLLVSHRFIVPTAFIGATEKPNATIIGNQYQILDGMLLVLATIVEPLLIRITGSVYGPVGAVVEKKAVLSDAVTEVLSGWWMSAVRGGSTLAVANA